MTWQIGSAIGEALCGVLGLDVKQVSRMVIDLRPGDIATVDVTIGIPSEANGDVAALSGSEP